MTGRDTDPGVSGYTHIDRGRSAERIRRDIATLSGPAYTSSPHAICRYAYTPQYRAAVDFFAAQLTELGFSVSEDPVGNLVARNRPRGEQAFGIGSHCDSNRNGGRFDGTLGVVTAVEVCRLSAELGWDLPLQVISFLEEEGSGFGQLLLGSRVMAGLVDDIDLRERFRAIDDGGSFWEHASQAGHEPARWRECGRALDGLTGWIELHIEQGRMLQDAGRRVGIVTAIAGYRHGDVEVRGRADHAGATPMDGRQDAGTVAAACVLELERLASEASRTAPTVGTVGAVTLSPGIINVIPGRADFTLDIRGVSDEVVSGVFDSIAAYAGDSAARRGMTAAVRERQVVAATPMAAPVVQAIEAAVRGSGEPYLTMHSGAAHDTMCVAGRVPAGMVFLPCRDGLSHVPEEEADPADAAVGAEVMVNAIRTLTGQ